MGRRGERGPAGATEGRDSRLCEQVPGWLQRPPVPASKVHRRPTCVCNHRACGAVSGCKRL